MSDRGTISERGFIGRRRPTWEALERLLTQTDRTGLRRLGASRAQELALLYRSVTTDLAAARSRGYDATLVAYLNRLVARAHAYVYAGMAPGGWARLGELFARGFPREVRASRGPILSCTAIFAVAAIVA